MYFLAMGASLWSTQADTDRTHQHRESVGSESSSALPVLSWGGQTGQVLGPGIQQGKFKCRVRGGHVDIYG